MSVRDRRRKDRLRAKAKRRSWKWSQAKPERRAQWRRNTEKRAKERDELLAARPSTNP